MPWKCRDSGASPPDDRRHHVHYPRLPPTPSNRPPASAPPRPGCPFRTGPRRGVWLRHGSGCAARVVDPGTRLTTAQRRSMTTLKGLTRAGNAVGPAEAGPRVAASVAAAGCRAVQGCRVCWPHRTHSGCGQVRGYTLLRQLRFRMPGPWSVRQPRSKRGLPSSLSCAVTAAWTVSVRSRQSFHATCTGPGQCARCSRRSQRVHLPAVDTVMTYSLARTARPASSPCEPRRGPAHPPQPQQDAARPRSRRCPSCGPAAGPAPPPTRLGDRQRRAGAGLLPRRASAP